MRRVPVQIKREGAALDEILRDVFGWQHFRGQQERVIRTLVAGESALVIMPTGFGKSLCYQMPSVVLSGLTLVVSPLVALMKDQVDSARQVGLSAAAINSSLDSRSREQHYQRLKDGQFQLLYITPERFRKAEFWDALSTQTVSLLAIDEAHCISQWGHDFRPDYSRLGDIRTRLGNPVTVALTATATPEVQTDILRQLRLDETSTSQFIDGMERPNLDLEVQEVYGWDEKIRWMVLWRHQHPGPTIVYFSLVASLEAVSRELRKLGMDHAVYHGQMKAGERRREQDRFLRGDQDLILATPAFGLGIDKSNVRSVIHAEIPGSIEAYYQEVGRAGRDGQTAHCLLLSDPDDITIQMDFIKWSNPDPGFIREVYRYIETHPEKMQQEPLETLRRQMNFYNSRDFRVETAVNLLERWDSVEVDHRGALKALAPPPEELLSSEDYQKRWRGQNEKLLKLVELLKSGEDLKPQIYRYFGVT